MEDWIISVFCGILGGLVGASFHYFQLNWRVNEIQGALIRVQNAISGGIGNQKKAEQESRMQEALVFAMSKMQGAEKPDLQAVLKETAARYPDVAMKLMTKLKL